LATWINPVLPNSPSLAGVKSKTYFGLGEILGRKVSGFVFGQTLAEFSRSLSGVHSEGAVELIHPPES